MGESVRGVVPRISSQQEGGVISSGSYQGKQHILTVFLSSHLEGSGASPDWNRLVLLALKPVMAADPCFLDGAIAIIGTSFTGMELRMERFQKQEGRKAVHRQSSAHTAARTGYVDSVGRV